MVRRRAEHRRTFTATARTRNSASPVMAIPTPAPTHHCGQAGDAPELRPRWPTSAFLETDSGDRESDCRSPWRIAHSCRAFPVNPARLHHSTRSRHLGYLPNPLKPVSFQGAPYGRLLPLCRTRLRHMRGTSATLMHAKRCKLDKNSERSFISRQISAINAAAGTRQSVQALT